MTSSRTSRAYSLIFAVSLAVTVPLIAGCSSVNTKANAQELKPAASTAQNSPTPAPSTQNTAAIPESAHTVKRGETVLSLARTYLSQSSLMTVAELDAAIRDANHLGKTESLKPGATITIPTLEKQPIIEKTRPLPKDADIRAVYLTGTMAGSVNGMNIVKHWKQVGGNAVVFDIKDSDGSINVPFNNPLAPKRRPSISNLPKYVRWLHSMDMHAIARIALFRDENIAVHHPELAVHSHAHPDVPWRENGKLVWTDSSNPQVQDYDLALAKMVAQSGADEIQFDYVRFPAEGDQKDAVFHFQTLKNADGTPMQRRDVIANFLGRAHDELHPMGVLLSIDVFGVMAWQRQVDLGHTGQDIVAMAKNVDIVSPMIYPSHFFGMDNIAQPGDAPEHFISESMARFQKITADSGVTLRPWLQAFAWRTKTYSPEYIKIQVQASKANGGDGFLLWNARNDYAKPFAAMPDIMSAKEKYLGKKTQALASTPAAAVPIPAAQAPASIPKPHQ